MHYGRVITTDQTQSQLLWLFLLLSQFVSLPAFQQYSGMISHWRWGRELWQQKPNVGYFYNTTEDCNCIYIAESSWLMHLQLQFIEDSIYVLFSLFNSHAFHSTFYCSRLGRHAAPSLVGLLCLLLRTQCGSGSKEKHGSGCCGQGHGSCFVTYCSVLFIPVHKEYLETCSSRELCVM